MTIRISIICQTEESRTHVAASDPMGIGATIRACVGEPRDLGQVLAQDQPDVTLLELPVPDDASMEQLEQALQQSPATHLVLVSPEHSEAFLMRAMRAGVREVLPGPMSPDAVQLAVKHARLSLATMHQRQAHRAMVLALIPAKGGAGATFVATNLAYTLSKMGQQVLVLDLNLCFGDASIFLGDRKPVSTVVDLASQTERLDATLLDSAVIKVSENLHILPAPELPADLIKISTLGIEKIISIAQAQYDFVFLDVSSTLDAVAVKALDAAEVVYMVLQLNLPFIRAAKHMAMVFRSRGYPREKLRVLVNRYEGGGTIGLNDVESATLLKVTLTLPNSHTAVNESINQGIPLLELTPHDPVARALHDWAQKLAPSASVPRPRNWLNKLLRAA